MYILSTMAYKYGGGRAKFYLANGITCKWKLTAKKQDAFVFGNKKSVNKAMAKIKDFGVLVMEKN